ncbi:hypothetical protein FXO37_18935 [Capsicum annuum]|nr:hypothetical protein FXO37_18935 [Capsicum annuum]
MILMAILQVKKNLQNDLEREPTDGEVADAPSMDAFERQKKLKVRRDARNKLIKRVPTDEEIIERVGLSPKRYHEVMKVSKVVSSLHARNMTTQEVLINEITDVDGVDRDKRK